LLSAKQRVTRGVPIADLEGLNLHDSIFSYHTALSLRGCHHEHRPQSRPQKVSSAIGWSDSLFVVHLATVDAEQRPAASLPRGKALQPYSSSSPSRFPSPRCVTEGPSGFNPSILLLHGSHSNATSSVQSYLPTTVRIFVECG
jgi:hypothetical protein